VQPTAISTTASPLTSIPPTPEPPVSCPASLIPNCPIPEGVNSTFFPHPHDCNWFFYCSHGTTFCKRCPGILHWNTKLDTCDSPHNAGCVAVPNPSPTPGGPPVYLVCPCRLVTNNLCVSTWTGTEEYCRAEAMGVILVAGYSTIIETKKFIKSTSRSTDRSSGLNVQIKSTVSGLGTST